MNGSQKAIVGAIASAIIAFLSVLSGALTEGAAISDLDAQTWINAVIALLGGLGITGGAVYAVPNKTKDKGKPEPYLEP